MRVLKVGLLAGALLAAMFAPAASATDWSSVESVSARTSQSCVGGTKIDIAADFVNGTSFALLGGGSVTLSITSTGAGDVLSFQTDSGHLVTSVIIKGGPITVAALKYNYIGGTTADSGLHASLNPNSGKWYGVSHACFTSVKKDDEKK